jgi:hypothetical protein
MIYKLNEVIFDINAEHQIGETVYPRTWFLNQENRDAMGITEEPDPIIPPYVPTTEEIVGIMQMKYSELWRAATEYQENYISGAAIGLLTIGVIQGKPKALAIMAWIQDIWMNHYYPQKALLTYASTIYDFSACGMIPYTVPELTAEVLG